MTSITALSDPVKILADQEGASLVAPMYGALSTLRFINIYQGPISRDIVSKDNILKKPSSLRQTSIDRK